MKRIILVMDEDIDYSKKFCNQANKLYGKKYVFITFSNVKSLMEYAKTEDAESIVTTETVLQNIDELNVHSIYLLNEKSKEIISEGKKKYVYKLQNVKNILDVIDKDIEKRYAKSVRETFDNKKLILFYAADNVKGKMEIVKKIAKALSKKKQVLVVDLDEFDNYKGSVGLSNIIFNYKENKISVENLNKEIIEEKGVYFIKSVTYPDDFNVISNIDLANIINEIMNLPFDYIFVNADNSFVKCEYILNDVDKVIIIKENNSPNADKFKNYLKSENIIDIKKINEMNITKMDRPSYTNFVKQVFSN